MARSKLSDDLDDYVDLSAAVGRLFLKWADLENSLSAGLKLHLQSRLSRPRGSKEDQRLNLAAAIYGGMRLKTSRDIVKRILIEEAAGERVLEFHKAFFEHIAHIEHLRDLLAHQFLRRSDVEGHWVVHDAATTKTFSRPKAYEITDLSILKAAADLHTASMRTGDLISSDGRRKRNLTPPTWHYKSSMLKLLPHKRLLSLREYWLRPEASQA